MKKLFFIYPLCFSLLGQTKLKVHTKEFGIIIVDKDSGLRDTIPKVSESHDMKVYKKNTDYILATRLQSTYSFKKINFDKGQLKLEPLASMQTRGCLSLKEGRKFRLKPVNTQRFFWKLCRSGKTYRGFIDLSSDDKRKLVLPEEVCSENPYQGY